MTAGVRSTTVTVHRAVYLTDHHASVNLVYHSWHGRPQHNEENRTEHNLFVRSGKSEAEVTNGRSCSTYCTIEVTDSREALCDSRATCFLSTCCGMYQCVHMLRRLTLNCSTKSSRLCQAGIFHMTVSDTYQKSVVREAQTFHLQYIQYVFRQSEI